MAGRSSQNPCVIVTDGCLGVANILVLIVGGISFAMPTVLSVTLAIGSSALAEENAIVTRLTCIEEMASIEVLCSDKTGTLTLNQLSVDMDNLIPYNNFTAEGTRGVLDGVSEWKNGPKIWLPLRIETTSMRLDAAIDACIQPRLKLQEAALRMVY
ncbi:hypothetical protein PsorP6_012696 [Peronosclerospora sorghi]|uniref:Uncharacterized protein n=1 Tax=Peronosclerospora sorghi TaxID=230839 RepID=A0ACC0WGL1_9STRA|nr:hypothetical protein PsorP6_012696 [Peronosclerospora sorghi]